MRIEHWEDQLYAYIEASKDLQFVWGQNDCSLWAAKWLDIVNGSNIVVDWLGLNGDEEGATALMAERGFANCEAVADSLFAAKHIRMASRGDMVLHQSGALGICDGRRSYFLTPDSGLGAVLTTTCRKAWAV